MLTIKGLQFSRTQEKQLSPPPPPLILYSIVLLLFKKKKLVFIFISLHTFMQFHLCFVIGYFPFSLIF